MNLNLYNKNNFPELLKFKCLGLRCILAIFGQSNFKSCSIKIYALGLTLYYGWIIRISINEGGLCLFLIVGADYVMDGYVVLIYIQTFFNIMLVGGGGGENSADALQL